jgi:sugar lactone lactonase YvrE
MKKQNILALASKPAMRVTKSVGIGIVLMLTATVVAMVTPSAASASSPCQGPTATRLVTGLEGAMGSTIGPDGALYVTEGAAGRISRFDPQTGEVTTFASGLPPAIPAIGIGGAIDIAFIDNIAYVLVTLVNDPLFPSSDVDGIYRVDGPNSFTVVADIGAFDLANPPTIPFPYFIATGLQFKLETYRGGFLVSDSHLNRVLRVTLNGEISVLIDFGNIVPAGLEVRGNTVYMTEAGPDPHLPQDGKVVSFDPRSPTATEVASNVPFLLDVEFDGGGRLYTLSHGTVDPDIDPSNAVPNTGALVKVNEDGTFTVIMDGLDRPTSLEFIGNTAYFVTLTGEIWKIDGVSCRH